MALLLLLFLLHVGFGLSFLTYMLRWPASLFGLLLRHNYNNYSILSAQIFTSYDAISLITT
jgi:hypothetical protein